MTQTVRHIVVESRHPRRDREPRAARLALRIATLVLCLGAAVAIWPFWAPLVLAAWAAIVARPLQQLLARRIHRRKGAAAVLTVLLVIAFLTPLTIAILSLSGAAIELGQRLLESKSGVEALRSLAVNGGASFDLRQLNLDQLVQFSRQHGASALGVAKLLFGAATFAVVGLLIFVAAFYTFLLHGPRLYEWLIVHAPLRRGHFHRLSGTFAEVGRGLLIGVGLTALLQGAVATVGYLALGVPQPLVLGLVTVFASLIPSIGSGLVWLPVAAGLALAGRPGAAVAMLVIGCVVSLVDNVMRPLLARYGQLHLHGLVIFITMLGGMVVFGPGGLLLGPLLARLAVEVLSMLRETSPSSFPDA
ncbi:MAG TPA: AI-2E family transporter [Polyangiaceae bacterium]|nr:AI-2E family transporter [Polyangiaceae bacterium]